MLEVQALPAVMSFEEFSMQRGFRLWEIKDIYDYFYKECMLRGLRNGRYHYYTADITLFNKRINNDKLGDKLGICGVVQAIYWMVEEVANQRWYRLALQEPVSMVGISAICNEYNLDFEMPANLDFMSTELHEFLMKLNYLLYLMQYQEIYPWYNLITKANQFRFQKTILSWDNNDKPQNIVDLVDGCIQQMPNNNRSAYAGEVDNPSGHVNNAFKWNGTFNSYSGTDEKWYYTYGLNYGLQSDKKELYAYTQWYFDRSYIRSDLDGGKTLWQISDGELFWGCPYGYDFRLENIVDKTKIDGYGYSIISFTNDFTKILYNVPATNFGRI